ncbi:MAG: lamin tail domain-containing protein [Candidatus Cloacimonetes bacterium]|nr:lamin tail domain-containing protein [Candidatus Cloacimonadota bacterium]
MRKHILVSLASMITLCISALTLQAYEIKINEILYDPEGGDTGKEWIELYNSGTEPEQLEGWQIQKGGSNFEECFTFPEYIIYPGEYLLIGESQVPDADLIGVLAFQNGGTATDGVRIISAEGDTIDTILYDFPNTNNLPGDSHDPGIFFAVDVSSGHSLIRYPNGHDTDNCEEDFFDCEYPTPGEPNIIPQDVVLQNVTIQPPHPDSTDIVSLHFSAYNNSDISIQADSCSYKIFVFGDLISEGIIAEEIQSHGTHQIEVQLGIFEDGLYEFYVELILSTDTTPSNNSYESSFLVGESPIIINEIMYMPGTPNVEWIELFNDSENTFLVLNWHIRDATSGWNVVVTQKSITPFSYIVITEDTTAVRDFYGYDIVLVQTNDWASLNNTSPDEVHISDKYYTQLDSMGYDPAEFSCSHNYSLERIDPYENISLNWGVSVDSLGATPGNVNSITPKEYDISVISLSKVSEGETLELHAVCKNVGFNPVEGAEYIFFDDINWNAQYDEGEELDTGYFDISTGDSTSFSYSFIPESGYYRYGFYVKDLQDMDNSNNLMLTTHNTPGSHPICINEIQAAPQDEQPEWIELFNIFDHELDISGWTLADKSDTLILQSAKSTIAKSDYIVILPDENDSLALKAYFTYLDTLAHFVFAWELPSLNNDEDILVLRDANGCLIDSIHYYSDWKEVEDNSLERINPYLATENSDNWDSSVSSLCATPGKQNSIYVEHIIPKVELNVTPNPLSYREKKSVLIEYNLPEPITKINIRIFDMKGRMVRWLTDQQWVAAHGTIIWDCKNENGNVVPIGIYIIHLEGGGKQSNKIYEKTTTMVIGEK